MRTEGRPGMAGVLRWRGVLAEGGAALRRVSAAVLAVACVALAFTQTGFAGVQFASGDAAYLVVLLQPVALVALLLGTLPGAGMGLFAGTVLFAHAALMPLDYYELTFVTPFTSIVMMALSGLLAGVLFALVLRRRRSAWARIVLLALACLAVSFAFSAGFSASTVALLAQGLGVGQAAQVQAQVQEIALTAGSAAFQTVGDALIMAVAVLIARRCAERGLRLAQRAGLRAVFGAWLSAVLAAAFMAVATGAYIAISAGALVQAHEDMASEVAYLLGQVERTADYNGKVVAAVMGTGADNADAGGLDELLSDGMLASLLEGYTEEGDGLVLVATGKYLTGSDAARFEAASTLDECLSGEAMAAVERSAAEGTLERVVYEAPSAMNDLVDFTLPGGAGAFDDLLTPQIGYLVAVEHDDYAVTMVRPARMVFAERDDVMGWVTAAFLVLLAAVFALAWRLLDLMVARRIDAANGALARITAGEMDARVSAQGTREFAELAAGINGTVDALQGWIAEAEGRMDAELATAKAIQESALPRVFPPYPDILKFDVYATMDAAREVGGDFYDFFLIGDADAEAGKLGFVVADVSGKGVPAALFMMKAKTQLRDYLEAGMQVGEAVENANRQLVDGNDAGMFVTCWVGVLDYATGRVEFVNAGHNPPLLWRSDGGGGEPLTGCWTWLKEKSGLPLGLFDGMPYEAHAIDCRAGDTFLLYTDGVTEAMSVEGDLYGEARLEALANANSTLHPRELVARVRRDVAAHAAGAEQSDDITVLALEVGVPPEEKAVLAVPADVAELPRVNEFIHAELDRRLCPVRAQNQLDIAVEELFVNVCHYAYEDMPPEVPRTVRVTYAYSAEPPGITVEIIDAGAPYDPLAKPDAATADTYDSVADMPIGGLGILMAKSSVDEMSYERTGDSNVVTLVKRW